MVHINSDRRGIRRYNFMLERLRVHDAVKDAIEQTPRIVDVRVLQSLRQVDSRQATRVYELRDRINMKNQRI
jgi:hypothetical protein